MINPKFTVQDLSKFDLAGRIESLSSTKKVLLAGAAAGALKTGVDNTEDTAGTTALNIGAGAGAGYGVKQVAQWVDKKASEELVDQTEKKSNDVAKKQDQKETKAMARTVTRKEGRLTVSRMQAKEIQGHYAPKVQARKTSRKMKSWMNGVKVSGALGLGAFALASVMDTSETLAEDKRTSRQVADQERKLERKKTKESRQQDKLGYGHVDMGQMAIDLFNERTGHYKMGNAKFQ